MEILSQGQRHPHSEGPLGPPKSQLGAIHQYQEEFGSIIHRFSLPFKELWAAVRSHLGLLFTQLNKLQSLPQLEWGAAKYLLSFSFLGGDLCSLQRVPMTSSSKEHTIGMHRLCLPPPAPGEHRRCSLFHMFPIQELSSLSLQAQISLALFFTCPKSSKWGLAHAEHLPPPHAGCKEISRLLFPCSQPGVHGKSLLSQACRPPGLHLIYCCHFSSYSRHFSKTLQSFSWLWSKKGVQNGKMNEKPGSSHQSIVHKGLLWV